MSMQTEAWWPRRSFIGQSNQQLGKVTWKLLRVQCCCLQQQGPWLTAEETSSRATQENEREQGWLWGKSWGCSTVGLSGRALLESEIRVACGIASWCWQVRENEVFCSILLVILSLCVENVNFDFSDSGITGRRACCASAKIGESREKEWLLWNLESQKLCWNSVKTFSLS